MDYFAKFLKPKPEAHAVQTDTSNSEGLGTSVGVEGNKWVQVVEVPPAANADDPPKEESCVALGRVEEFERTKEKVCLWDTKIQKVVQSSKLVWAPYYRFRNQPFCARICENNEVERDLYIQLPVLDTECVVEFICAPMTKKKDTRLLKVDKNKIVPYFGKEDPASLTEEQLGSWNEKYLDKMRKALREHFTISDTEHVYSSIVERAKDYLREALTFDRIIESGRQKHPLQRALTTGSEHSTVKLDQSPLRPLPPRQGAPHLPAPQPQPQLQVHSEGFARTGSKDSAPEALQVGDFIRYRSEILTDQMVFARIVGLTGDPLTPLVLDNAAQLLATKRVAKLVVAPVEEHAEGYDPLSGHFRPLSDYVVGGQRSAASPPTHQQKDSTTPPPQPQPPAAASRASRGARTAGDAAAQAGKPQASAGPSARKARSAAPQTASTSTGSTRGTTTQGAAAVDRELEPAASAVTAETSATGSSAKYDWLSEQPLVPTRRHTVGSATTATATTTRTTPAKGKHSSPSIGQANLPAAPSSASESASKKRKADTSVGTEHTEVGEEEPSRLLRSGSTPRERTTSPRNNASESSATTATTTPGRGKSAQTSPAGPAAPTSNTSATGTRTSARKAQRTVATGD